MSKLLSIYPGSGWSENAVLFKLPLPLLKKVSRVIPTSFGFESNPYSCKSGCTLLENECNVVEVHLTVMVKLITI